MKAERQTKLKSRELNRVFLLPIAVEYWLLHRMVKLFSKWSRKSVQRAVARGSRLNHDALSAIGREELTKR